MKLFVKNIWFFFKEERSEQGCFEELSYTGSALFHSMRGLKMEKHLKVSYLSFSFVLFIIIFSLLRS